METRSYDRRGTILVQFLRCLGVFLKFVAIWSVVIFHVFETRKCSPCSPNYFNQHRTVWVQILIEAEIGKNWAQCAINNRSFLDINYYNSMHMSIKQISVELLLRLQRPIKSDWKTKFRWYFTLQNDLLRKSNFLTHTSAYGTFVTPCIIKSGEHKYLMWSTNNSWLTQKWIDLRPEIKIP